MEKHKVPTCPFCNHEMTVDDMYRHPDDLLAIAPNESSAIIVYVLHAEKSITARVDTSQSMCVPRKRMNSKMNTYEKGASE